MTVLRQLADCFPKFAEADWRASIERARRGAGGAVPSLPPRRADGRPIFRRPRGQPWVAVQRVDAAKWGDALAFLSEDIAGGAFGAELALADNAHPLGGRLRIDELQSAVAPVLDELPPGFQLRLACHDPALIADETLDRLTRADLDLVLTCDPIAALAAGRIANTAALDAAIARLVSRSRVRPFKGAVLVADGRLWHAGGATDEQELAAVVATFVTQLRRFGVDTKIDVTLAADPDQYRTIAKFRALRMLLSRIAEVAALGTEPPRIHAETAWRVMGARNSEMNVLRATSAAFGAAVGGADSITVLPFDSLAHGRTDSHARRLARNTHAILAEEANLHRVADPAAGAGLLEGTSGALAEAAWRRFQQIESEGGILAAIGNGSLLQEIAEAREARLARVATGDTLMVGVNAYTGTPVQLAERVGRTPVRMATRLVFKRHPEAFEVGAP